MARKEDVRTIGGAGGEPFDFSEPRRSAPRAPVECGYFVRSFEDAEASIKRA
jgi:hypothetical protein